MRSPPGHGGRAVWTEHYPVHLLVVAQRLTPRLTRLAFQSLAVLSALAEIPVLPSAPTATDMILALWPSELRRSRPRASQTQFRVDADGDDLLPSRLKTP